MKNYLSLGSKINRDLLNKIIQVLVALAVLGAIAFMGAGMYQWGKSSCPKPSELKMPMIQGNSLLPIPQVKEEIIYAKVTAYNSVPEQTDSTPFITASGERVYSGGIACPSYLKFGTLVQIDGEIYECNDRTAPKNDGTFDKWVETIEEAVNWGVPVKEITLLTF